MEKRNSSSRILFNISPRMLRHLPVRLEGPGNFFIIRNEYWLRWIDALANISISYAIEIVFHPSQLEKRSCKLNCAVCF